MHWGRERIRVATLGLLLPLVLGLAACGGDDESSPGTGTSSSTPAESVAAPSVQLAGVKGFLDEHTDQLAGFTKEFNQLARRYHELAEAEDFEVLPQFVRVPHPAVGRLQGRPAAGCGVGLGGELAAGGLGRV